MNILDEFEKVFGRKPSQNEASKLMNLSAKLEKDKVRKSLHGNTKNISAKINLNCTRITEQGKKSEKTANRILHIVAW